MNEMFMFLIGLVIWGAGISNGSVAINKHNGIINWDFFMAVVSVFGGAMLMGYSNPLF